MAIQWFPGHMHKARKEMAEVLPGVDVLVEVLDARIPYSSENPMLGKLSGDKPKLRVLTKSDLADPEQTQLWLQALGSDATSEAIAISTSEPDTFKQISDCLRVLQPHKPGRIKPKVAMIVGIPNVGKSTLINQLAGRTVARTGNEPAITKRQQPITLADGWIIRDTPGVLWPNVENPASGFRLAATGAVRDTAMDSGEVAATLLDYLREVYPTRLQARYGGKLPMRESVETLEAIGRFRGCLGGGGLVDFDRSGRLLLNEFRSGQLGRMTLETPAMQTLETAAVIESNRLRDEKREAKRLDRRARRKARRQNS